jgi:hypothetical protein
MNVGEVTVKVRFDLPVADFNGVKIYYNEHVAPKTLWPFADGYMCRSREDLEEMRADFNKMFSDIIGGAIKRVADKIPEMIADIKRTTCDYHANYVNGHCSVCGVKCPNPNCKNGKVGMAGCAICGGIQARIDSSAPSCNKCGALMQRNGSCYACDNCGSTSGCS